MAENDGGKAKPLSMFETAKWWADRIKVPFQHRRCRFAYLRDVGLAQRADWVAAMAMAC
jgi:hypothetical protein